MLPRALPTSPGVAHARVAAGVPTVARRRLPSSLRPAPRTATTVTHAQWLDNSAEISVAAPLEACWEMWEARERIPSWMPWIASVEVQPDDDRMSRWLLSTEQFGRQWQFSWLAQNLTPVRHQKIHWRSVPGSTGGSLGGAIDIANRGAIRFYRDAAAPKGACAVKLTISYEVPDVLAPVANAVSPLVERVLAADLARFKELAEREHGGK